MIKIPSLYPSLFDNFSGQINQQLAKFNLLNLNLAMGLAIN